MKKWLCRLFSQIWKSEDDKKLNVYREGTSVEEALDLI